MIKKKMIVNNSTTKIAILRKNKNLQAICDVAIGYEMERISTLNFTFEEFDDLVVNQVVSKKPLKEGVYQDGDLFLIIKDGETVSLYEEEFKDFVLAGQQLSMR